MTLLRALSIALLLIPGAARYAPACAPAPPQGMFVRITEESAVIVWDSANKTQHFIRRASFRSDAPDFGFLVPTPARPELAEASEEAFDVLQYILRPKVVESEERGIRWMLLFAEFFLAGRGYDTAAPIQSVRVLSTQRVAGYDAAVLQADDAESLNAWLEEHGYPASPALQKWLNPYVAMKWVVTAFKVGGNSDSGEAAPGSVRMSFSADRPFFPYREPQVEVEQGNRILQVFVLSDVRMEGKLGEEADVEWPGHLQWANRLLPEDQSRLLQQLGVKAANMSAGLWLSAFEDRSSPRPGTADLFFQPAAEQSSQVPPPTVITHDRRIPLPVDLLLLLTGVIGTLLLRRARH